jgi:hypothetical protein
MKDALEIAKKMAETTSLKEFVDKYFAPKLQENQFKFKSSLNFGWKSRRFTFLLTVLEF